MAQRNEHGHLFLPLGASFNVTNSAFLLSSVVEEEGSGYLLEDDALYALLSPHAFLFISLKDRYFTLKSLFKKNLPFISRFKSLSDGLIARIVFFARLIFIEHFSIS